jgi:hypothetical protein
MKNTMLIFFALLTHSSLRAITLTAEDIHKIGQKIWNNEGSCQIDKLTWWNPNEPFPSLGIGHFIWYPKGHTNRFTDAFPDLLAFIKRQGKKLPSFLDGKENPPCPWHTREEFYNAFNSKKMTELRTFLVETIDLQTKFIIHRIEKALPNILEYAPCNQHADIKKQFYRVASSAMGLYALIDYTNFKGEGISIKEAYHGKGWGLLQVLQKMNGDKAGITALYDFSAAAVYVLTQRVKNSPNAQQEARWLPGWKNRVNSYTQPFVKPNKNSCI